MTVNMNDLGYHQCGMYQRKLNCCEQLVGDTIGQFVGLSIVSHVIYTGNECVFLNQQLSE